MTNELGTTLQDIEAKAARKQKALSLLTLLYANSTLNYTVATEYYQYIVKYIEEN